MNIDTVLYIGATNDLVNILFLATASKLTVAVAFDSSFNTLKDYISEQTSKAVVDMGFTHMTEIQAKAIPHLLEGRFVNCLFVFYLSYYHYCLKHLKSTNLNKS